MRKLTEEDGKWRLKVWLLLAIAAIIVSSLFLMGKPTSTRCDLIVEDLKKDASSSEFQTEYISTVGESNKILHLKFQSNPVDTRKRLVALCKEYGWTIHSGSDELDCQANNPGVYDWIYWNVNTKSVTSWDPSYKSSLGIHYRRSRLQVITDYLRSLVGR